MTAEHLSQPERRLNEAQEETVRDRMVYCGA